MSEQTYELVVTASAEVRDKDGNPITNPKEDDQ